MNYHFTTSVKMPFDQAIELATNALQAKGFGVLTTIDVSATLKKKLDVDTPGYVILGACNPGLAWQALQLEEKIGTMLPCNVIVQQKEDRVEISAIDPLASMQAIDNPGLGDVADKVRGLLSQMIDEIAATA